MEAVLKSLDQRVGRIEQILPTLATKQELRDEIRGVRVLVEDVRGEVRQLAEGVHVLGQRLDAEAAGLSRRMDDMSTVMRQQFVEVLRRLPRR